MTSLSHFEDEVSTLNQTTGPRRVNSPISGTHTHTGSAV